MCIIVSLSKYILVIILTLDLIILVCWMQLFMSVDVLLWVGVFVSITSCTYFAHVFKSKYNESIK